MALDPPAGMLSVAGAGSRRRFGWRVPLLVGTLLVLLSALSYGTMPVLAKLAYAAGAGPMTVLLVRYLTATTIVWAWVLLRGRGIRVAPRRGFVMIGLGFVLVIISFSAFFAYERIPAGTASLLVYVYPAVVAIFGALAGERLGLPRWVAVGTAIIGCWLTAGGAPSGSDPLGLGFALLAGLSSAVYIFASERISRGVPSVDGAALLALGPMLVVGVVSLVTGDRPDAVPPAAWLWSAAIGVVSSVLGLAFFQAGIQRLGSSRASLIATVEPAYTVLLGFLVFGELLTPIQLAGGALILGALVAQHFVDRGERRPRAAPD